MNGIVLWFKARSLRVRVLLVAGVAVLLLCLGGGLVRGFLPRMETTTVTDSATQEQLKRVTTENQDLNEQLARTQNQLLQLQSMRVTTTHTVRTPGGLVTTDTTTRVDTHESQASQTVTADTKKADTAIKVDESSIRNTDTATKTVVEPVPDPRFLASVGVGVLPFRGAGFAGLVSLDARVIGPLYLGAWTMIPVTDLAGTAVGLKAGVRF